jgi:hypothetical protein
MALILDNKQIALNWIAAFNSHNLVALLSLYHEEAAHYSPKLKISRPETNGLIIGKNALHSWWHEAFQNIPSLQYTLTNLIIENGQVLMEYNREVAMQATLKVAEILEIENGLIIKSRVYHG